MKKSIGFGLMLLSILLALSFGVAFAEKNITASEKGNATKSVNITNATTNTTNVTSTVMVPESTVNVTKPQNATESNATTNETKAQNVTNPFAKAKGSLPGGGPHH